MRGLRRLTSSVYAEWRLSSRRATAAPEIRKHLGLPDLPELVPYGNRGCDSIYLVKSQGAVFGVLRLLNPYKMSKPPFTGMPFVVPSPAARISREAEICRKGAPGDLTPAVLWQAEDALLCAHAPLRQMHGMLMAAPETAWKILSRASSRIAGLHLAGATHMDASLHNTLSDEKMERLLFIDFEFAPAPHVPAPAQRIYDHLHLVESAWKFMPLAIRAQDAEWFGVFASVLDSEMKSASLDILAPALPRVLGDPVFSRKIREAMGK